MKKKALCLLFIGFTLAAAPLEAKQSAYCEGLQALDKGLLLAKDKGSKAKSAKKGKLIIFEPMMPQSFNPRKKELLSAFKEVALLSDAFLDVSVKKVKDAGPDVDLEETGDMAECGGFEGVVCLSGMGKEEGGDFIAYFAVSQEGKGRPIKFKAALANAATFKEIKKVSAELKEKGDLSEQIKPYVCELLSAFGCAWDASSASVTVKPEGSKEEKDEEMLYMESKPSDKSKKGKAEAELKKEEKKTGKKEIPPKEIVKKEEPKEEPKEKKVEVVKEELKKEPEKIVEQKKEEKKAAEIKPKKEETEEPAGSGGASGAKKGLIISGITTLSVGGASAIAGGTLWLMSYLEYQKYKDSSLKSDAEDHRKKTKTYRDLSIYIGATGAGVAVIGAALLIAGELMEGGADAETAHNGAGGITPSLFWTPTCAGFTIQGNF